jgi:lipopolysaccharide transport system ATP-binding protein
MSSKTELSVETNAQSMLDQGQIAIRVQNLSKCYQIYNKPQDRLKQGLWRGRKQFFREFWALKDVSFEVKKGEAMGIIGRNGSGKSTLLQLICGTLTPTSGEVDVNGRVAALLELGAGFSPDFTGRENVYMNAAILGFSKAQVDAKFQEIVEFAEIGEFMEQPVKTYSSGMFVRLAFAVQVCVEPDILIVDEALAVGDVFFRQKCYARLERLRKSGTAILLASHTMPDIEQYCERAILLDHGAARFIGSASEAAKHYYLQHQTQDPAWDLDKRTAVPSLLQMKTNSSGTVDLWPEDSAFNDASVLPQIINGMAKCTRYVLCDHRGNPRVSFTQGDIAVFYYEFLLLEPIAAPLGGVVLQNDKGILVHGKGSLEYGIDVPDYLPAGTLIRCRQSIELRVGVGEYTFELGLASIDPKIYKERSSLCHEELYGRVIRICHLANLGPFSVGLRKDHDGSQLTHHGVADLSGNFEFSFAQYAGRLP